MKLRLHPALQSGFTMIELLVVIAVIGVLSVAVLSSLNPIEQINKGRDTRSRADASQIIGATDRYFAIHEVYPWNVASATWPQATINAEGLDQYENEFSFDEDGTIAGSITDWGWADILATTSEVKQGFVTRISDTTDNVRFVLYKADGPNATMYACFEPASYAFDQEATERCTAAAYDADLPAAVICPVGCDTAVGDNTRCMVCLP